MSNLLDNPILGMLTTPHHPADLLRAVHPGLVRLPRKPPADAGADPTVGPAVGPGTTGTIVLPGAELAVTFTESGRTATLAEDQTLLDAAESAGLSPRTGCRRGVCHRCVVPLVAGVTRNSRDGTVAVAGDTLRVCVSTAMTDVEVAL